MRIGVLCLALSLGVVWPVICAGTALGSALVDVGKSAAGGRSQYFRPLGETKTWGASQRAREKLIEELIKAKQDFQDQLTDKLKAFEKLAGTALVDRDNNLKEQMAQEESVRRSDVQITYYRRGKGWRFMTDILGDDGAIGFHRFQIAAWTLVLGIIFVKKNLTRIAMPEFNATLLGLMGISAGLTSGSKFQSKRIEMAMDGNGVLAGLEAG
jgi:hypothetical protein